MTRPIDQYRQEPDKTDLDQLARQCRDTIGGGKNIQQAVSSDDLKRLQCRYGHFADQYDPDGYVVDSSYVVNRVTTPRPFVHLLASAHDREHGVWGSLWDQCGSGFSCLETPLTGPVTLRQDNSYVPTAPGKLEHRLFMVREQSTGEQQKIWHTFPQMGIEEESYLGFGCCQGTSSLKLTAARNDLDSELTVFVPVDDPLEVWRLKLTNKQDSPRRLSLFVAVNWGMESYPGHYFDPRVVCGGVVLANVNALMAVNNDKKNCHPRHGFLASARPWSRFDMNGESFRGCGAQDGIPEAVRQGACRNSTGEQPLRGLVSAMQLDLEFSPGETLTLEFLQGAASQNPVEAEKQIGDWREKYHGDQAFENQLNLVESRYHEMFTAQLARTPDKELDRFFNVWFKYQGRNGVRMPLSLNMVGYRDSLQCLMGITPFNPEYVVAHLPTVMRHQYEDGSAMRGFARHPGAPHDLRNYLDCCSWMADTLATYVQQTGDREFCYREEGFFDRAAGRVDETNRATLYEHARRSIEGLWNYRNEHGLCLIGHGDWNDSLDGVGADGRGVSVWLSMAFVFAACRFAGLARWLGEESDAAWAAKLAEKMSDIINSTSWDGQHYIYAFTGDGTPVGASSCAEGKIHLNVNAWSLFNGVANKSARVEQVLSALEEIDTPFGKLLISPPYTAASRHVGRIADMMPGLFENGSIYTHGHSFLAYGLVNQGMGGRAWREIRKVLPSSTIPDISTGPAHQVSNFTVGSSNNQFGCNFYSNFTGAVSWLRRSVERMLGLVADYDSLIIDPVVPSQWDSYNTVQQFRGCRITAAVENPDALERGVVRATLDGEELPVADGKSSLPVAMLAGRKKAGLKITLG
jgi:cellobiose phosphorylase